MNKPNLKPPKETDVRMPTTLNQEHSADSFFRLFGTVRVGRKVDRGILQIFKFEEMDSNSMNSQSTAFIELQASITAITRALIYIAK